MRTSTSAQIAAIDAELTSAPEERLSSQGYPRPAQAPDIGAAFALGRADPHDSSEIEALARDLGVLTTQNRQLIKGVSRLLDLYESERAQRQALQTSLDRILEEIASARPAMPTEAMATEVRQAVSDDLKPLLHAIIDLLEITMPRTPLELGATSEPAPPAPEASDSGNTAPLEPSDDLPRDLPEILKKSVEELMGNARHERSNGDAKRGGRGKESGSGRADPKPAIARRRRGFLNEDERGRAWIPVTSDTA